MKNTSRLILKSNIVNYIYKFELMKEELSNVEAFEKGGFSDNELKKIEAIAKNYDKFKALIVKHIVDGWSWTRLAPLERAILIYGAFELSFIPKALVINEMVILTQGYIPGDSYKFINSILEKIGAHFEQLKTN